MPSPARTPSKTPSLSVKTRPNFSKGESSVRLVDLFAGCGGLTLGVAQAARAAGLGLDVRLAVDFEQAPIDVYKANFKNAKAVTAAVERYFDGELGAPLTDAEEKTRAIVGITDLLVGGPPCQGHSDLNNKTRRNDPKNELYLRMARAAEVLHPKFVLVENVPTVRLDTAGVVQTTFDHLVRLHYKVATATISLHALGVAQKRRRHIMIASLVENVDPEAILAALASRSPKKSLDLKWAMKDLELLEDPVGYDIPPTASPTNLERMRYLDESGEFDLPNDRRPLCHQNDSHSYKSMYGRLRWDEPAQTITSGFGSIGQGRYMHPSQLRALTAHEAARIQGFPDYFSFAAAGKRADLAIMIGNAVPPALMREVAADLIPSLTIASVAVRPERAVDDITSRDLAFAG
jgi:DNA (cytosine-5)-methyltransferase 1